jgi:hypothetical protein
MRTLILVLVGLALLVAGPAGAEDNGTGDTHGLIALAAIQPFWSLGVEESIIEVTSPLSSNDLHVIYFDTACNRLLSKFKFVSWKGAIMFSPDLDGINANGLAVISSNRNNIAGAPIYSHEAIHVLGHWFNLAADYVHVVDPIAVSSPETGRKWSSDRQHYSPLRSAASFGAPIEAGLVPGVPYNTVIHLICPGPKIVGPTGVLNPKAGFGVAPKIAYLPVKDNEGNGSVFGNMYSGDEQPRVNFSLPCNCSSMFDLDSISNAYQDPVALGPELVSYTELYTYRPEPFTFPPPLVAFDPPTFVGYRNVGVGGTPGLDSFGRMNNGAAYNYRVNGADNVGTGGFDPSGPAPFFVPGLR